MHQVKPISKQRGSCFTMHKRTAGFGQPTANAVPHPVTTKHAKSTLPPQEKKQEVSSTERSLKEKYQLIKQKKEQVFIYLYLSCNMSSHYQKNVHHCFVILV